jgi:hypothetical protein
MRLHRENRRGTIIPTLALSIVGLMGLIALAVDIGLIAVARTQAQSAADISALSGARALNGLASQTFNISGSVSTAKNTATYNKILDTPVTASQTTVKTGVYKYDSTALRFTPDAASFTTSTTAAPPSGGSWTATEATINVTKPTYFARVLGINNYAVSATATAVHRPRDIALILDYSGSMKFSSVVNWPTGGADGVKSLNPDPNWPKFGHWSRYVGQATTGANPMQRTTDYTMSSGENNAPNNMTMETDNGPPIIKNFLTKVGSDYVNAFHNPQSGGYSMTYTPCATPAPNDFDVQSSATATYVGDKAPRVGNVATAAYAKTLAEVLGLTITSSTHTKNTTWEPDDNTARPSTYTSASGPLVNKGYGPSFVGYSVGPAYYGKTFWIWPPDPRVPYGDPGTAGYVPGDWRMRFFYYGSTAVNSTGGSIAGQRVDDNNVLFDSAGAMRAPSKTGYQVDYPAVLKWIKSGPKVLPDNLRAGRVLYYSAIPNDVTSTSDLDQVFWKKYIDYVLGVSGGASFFHGKEDTAWGTVRITSKYSLRNTGNRNSIGQAPYMRYDDNPDRPRAHFWFGPYTMLMFICDEDGPAGNMAPGTCSEAQCWQLKAGVQSALDDVQKNHPNDWVALTYFSDLSNYSTPRVKLGQDYAKMKNALWFPFTLLNVLGDPTQEVRPINSSYAYQLSGNVPNARGATCPDMGLKVAYNEFSTATGYNGRRGAAKMVILETDGVPNTSCTGTLNGGGPYQALYQSTSQIGTSTYVANGDSGVMNAALATVTQISKPDDAANRGYSTTRVPARVHAIAFGDLFETSTTTKTTALTFLNNVQINGKTTTAGGSLESYKIIVGDYNTRIANLRTAFERIMQGGVQVTLIK